MYSSSKSTFKVVIYKLGQGPAVAKGDMVTIHYLVALRLEDLEQQTGLLDSSYRRNAPIRFEVGAGLVIKGVEDALVGIHETSTIRILIPPELAFGDRGEGPVPRSSELAVEVFVQEVTKRNYGREA